MGLCVICQNRKTHFHAHFSPQKFLFTLAFPDLLWNRIFSLSFGLEMDLKSVIPRKMFSWIHAVWDGWYLVGWDGTENIFLPSSCFVIWEICFLPLNTRCISLLVSGDICWSHFQLKPPLGSQLKSSVPTNWWTIKQVDQHHKRLNVFSHTLF